MNEHTHSHEPRADSDPACCTRQVAIYRQLPHPNAPAHARGDPAKVGPTPGHSGASRAQPDASGGVSRRRVGLSPPRPRIPRSDIAPPPLDSTTPPTAAGGLDRHPDPTHLPQAIRATSEWPVQRGERPAINAERRHPEPTGSSPTHPAVDPLAWGQ